MIVVQQQQLRQDSRHTLKSENAMPLCIIMQYACVIAVALNSLNTSVFIHTMHNWSILSINKPFRYFCRWKVWLVITWLSLLIFMIVCVRWKCVHPVHAGSIQHKSTTHIIVFNMLSSLSMFFSLWPGGLEARHQIAKLNSREGKCG